MADWALIVQAASFLKAGISGAQPKCSCHLCPREHLTRELLALSPVDPLKRSQTLKGGTGESKGRHPHHCHGWAFISFLSALCPCSLRTCSLLHPLEMQTEPSCGVSQPWAACPLLVFFSCSVDDAVLLCSLTMTWGQGQRREQGER